MRFSTQLTLYALVVGCAGLAGTAKAQEFVSDGLVAFWTFDEADVDTREVFDVWGANNGPVINGSVDLEPGVVEDALVLDGQLYIEVPKGSDLDTALTGSPSFTIEFWARPEIQATEGWVGKGAGSASRAIRVRADPASWVLHFWDNDWNPNPVVPVVLGEWQHVVFTFDGTSNIGQAYTDGVFQGQHTFAAVDFASSPFWIGQEVWAGAASAMGRIDEMRVYDRVLIDAEITQNLGVQTNSLSVEPSGKLGVVWATLKRF